MKWERDPSGGLVPVQRIPQDVRELAALESWRWPDLDERARAERFMAMASAYPGGLDSFATTKSDSTTSATDHAAHHNDLADAINKVEAELGVNPSGSASTVAALNSAIVGRWAYLMDGHINISAAAVGTYIAHMAVTEDLLASAATPTTAGAPFRYLDPADYAITGYNVKFRVVLSYLQNATAIGGSVTLTAGMYPISSASTTTSWVTTLGGVVGSTAATGAGVPGASGKGRILGSAFTAPAADAYALAVVVAGATTAGFTRMNIRVEYSYA